MAGARDTTGGGSRIKTRLPGMIVAVILTLVALLFADRLIILNDLENYLVDYRLAHGRHAAFNPNLVYVSVDKTSYAGDFPDALIADAVGDDQYFMTLLRGEWPWTREIWAHVADRLIQSGARGVLLDFIFPGTKPEDPELKAVLERHHPRILIGALIDTGEGATSVLPPSPSLIEPDISGDTLHDPRVGLLNLHTDSDGVVRRGLFEVDFDSYLGLPPASHRPPPRTAAARAATLMGCAAFPPPGRLLRFTGPPGTFEPLSLKSLIDPAECRSRFFEREFFRDKFVVIGPGSAILNDYHRTPFTGHGAQMAGPEVLLQQINAALQGGFIAESGTVMNRAVLTATGLLLIVLTALPLAAWIRLIAGCLLTIAFVVTCFWLGDRHDYMLTSMFTPVALLNAGLFIALLSERSPAATTTAPS